MAARRKISESKTEDSKMAKDSNGKLLSDNGSLQDLHPFIIGLLQELPTADAVWEPARRALWVETATSIFKMIYQEAAPTPPAPSA